LLRGIGRSSGLPAAARRQPLQVSMNGVYDNKFFGTALFCFRVARPDIV
jgi:hypothetical protein